ncbi:MAG TPA: hypothetical protein VGC37_08045 [Friedmanniella sp.]
MTHVSSSSRSSSRRSSASRPTGRRLQVVLFVVAALVLVALVATIVVVLTGTSRDGAPAPVDASGCAAMTVPVRYLVNPATQTGVFTTRPSDAAAAVKAGWRQDEGVLFRVASRPAGGLVGVHQLRLGAGDQLWTTNSDEVREAVKSFGYVDQGVVAYASAGAAACTVQVERFQAHGVHRYATTAQERDSLRRAGWDAEGSFYAARPTDAAASPTATPTASSSQDPSGANPSDAGTPGPATSGPETVIDAPFDDTPIGPVTPDSFIGAVGPTNRADEAYDSMSYAQEPGAHGHFVRTHLAAHEILGRNDQPGDGNVLVVPLEDQSRDSACIAYDVRFSPGFEVSAGGKLPGLLGVAPGVSPGTPTGGGSTAHGWSGRIMWTGPKAYKSVRDSGQPDLAVTYLYHPGQTGTFGDDIPWGRGLVDGTWHSVRQCYTLNTIGRADGRLQSWLDGVQVVDRADLVYRTDPKVHITHLDWSVFRGGDTDDWAADTAGDVDLDNLKVTVG